jgi:hypothetical protein
MGTIDPGVAARLATTALVDDPPSLPLPARDDASVDASARDAR